MLFEYILRDLIYVYLIFALYELSIGVRFRIRFLNINSYNTAPFFTIFKFHSNVYLDQCFEKQQTNRTAYCT